MIYTKTGDMGITSLLGNTRVSKSSLRVRAYGAVDELEMTLGWASVPVQDTAVKKLLTRIQSLLFDAGSELATAAAHSKVRITAAHISELEMAIDEYTRFLGGFSFVKSGESESSSRLHMARTVTRRAEREIVALAAEEPVSPHLMVLVNRVSDLLYVLARFQSNWDQITGKLNGLVKSAENPTGIGVQEIQDAVLAYSREKGKGFAVALVDEKGGLEFFFRHPDTLPISTEMAMDKAYTAAVVRLSTEALGRLAQPGEALFGIGNASQGRIVTFGGGIPLDSSGKVRGAIGASGGTVPEDIALAELIKKIVDKEGGQNAG